MSVGGETLASIYRAEGLPEPALMPWPLDGEAEKRRLRLEEMFSRNTANLPPGLKWMESHTAAKYRPDRLLSGCRSVLVSSLEYFRYDAIDNQSGTQGSGVGRIARYARGRDYHKELGHRLRRIVRRLSDAFPGESFRAFTDIGPLDEVWLAESSGIGFRGRHGLAILNRSGSWVVLGHIVATVAFAQEPVRPSPLACPESCRRCIDACPTEALSYTGGMDTSRCLSYHTIEHSGPVDEALRSAAGNWIFGCDICQEACPFNRRVETTGVEAFQRNIAGPERRLVDLLALKNHDDFTETFAGSSLMRAGRSGMVRNACTVAGNSGDGELLPLLDSLISDDDQGVRSHAQWAADRIRKKS